MKKKVGIRRVTPGSNFEIESTQFELEEIYIVSNIFHIMNQAITVEKHYFWHFFWVPNSMYETPQLEEESSKESAL